MPQEVELCELLGITEEEYWFFVDKTESYNGQRSEAYNLIPDIQAGPLPAWAVQVIIGVVLSVVSYLLTPKPKQPKSRTAPSLTTASASGPKRFAPQTGFDSVQELAELGETVPLVFANRTGEYGGVRVNAKLLWSQLLSLGKGQQLKGVFMLSSGTLGVRPDFAGYAIGDMLLENYTNGKLALYYLNGSRTGTNSGRFLKGSDKYPEGTLDEESNNEIALPLLYSDEDAIYVDNIFCGTRSPRIQIQFGLYDPLPNSMKFMLPYELVLKPGSASNQDDIEKKRNKVATRYPRYACVYELNSSNTPGRFSVNKGDIIRYTLGDQKVDTVYTDFDPWGVEDVKSSVNATRESADDSIAIGEQFMFGTALAVCKNIVQDYLWKEGVPKDFDFEVTEPGEIDVRSVTNVHNSFELLIPQKCAIATVSNIKSCNTTEIGLKSTVWKQITGFSNVNSHPGDWRYGYDGVVKTYENDNGNISLGSINKYIKRLSFFHLFIRELGSNAEWIQLSDKPFCVTGRTPQPQYNFIRINHPFGQYEFRLVPYSGNKVKELYENQTVNRLGGTELVSLSHDQFDVRFVGSSNFDLVGNELSNEEWYLSDLPSDPEGVVLNLSSFNLGTVPTNMGWVTAEGPEMWFGDDIGKGTHARWNYWESFWVTWHNHGKGYVAFRDYDGRGAPVVNPERDHVEHGGYRYTLHRDPSDTYNGNIVMVAKQEWQPIEVNPTTYSNVSVTGGTGGNNSLKVNVQVYTKGSQTGYRWTIADGGSNYESGDTVIIPYANVQVVVFTDTANLITPPWPEGQNVNPFDAVSDYITFDAERSSHLDGPEHEITYVNEQIRGSNQPYTNLALAGIRMNSSKEWSSFSQLSVYVKEGVKVENLVTGDIESSNIFPDIAYALLTDPSIGAGDLIGEVSVDKDSMRTASRFCEANNFYWDGVVTDNQNLREFIYQQASYCFLDFTVIGGRFSLVPAVPYNSNYEIENHAQPVIKALFTDGNTKNLKVSFLSPEERQLFQARVLWRKEKENGFPETQVYELRLADSEGGSEENPRETFDMSVFCTNEEHVAAFAMFALKVRKEVDHGIKFETTPQAAMHLTPGQHFRFYSESTHTSRFANGVITDDGVIQSQSIVVNGTSIYYWKPGDAEVTGPANLVINGDLAASEFRGCVFTVAQTNVSDRVYKVESITYGEEGFIEIAGSYEPLTSTGSLATLDWGQNDFVGGEV